MSARRTVVVTAASAVVLAAMPWVLSDFLLSLTLSTLMYAGLAVSWAMFSGATHYLSLATAAFFGLGAYVTAWGVATLPWPLVVIGGGAVAALFAALVGSAVLHLRGAYFAVLTFGLGELIRHAITYVEKSYFRTVGRVVATAPPTSAANDAATTPPPSTTIGHGSAATPHAVTYAPRPKNAAVASDR